MRSSDLVLARSSKSGEKCGRVVPILGISIGVMNGMTVDVYRPQRRRKQAFTYLFIYLDSVDQHSDFPVP